jgi:hypothetical protein
VLVDAESLKDLLHGSDEEVRPAADKGRRTRRKKR